MRTVSNSIEQDLTYVNLLLIDDNVGDTALVSAYLASSKANFKLTTQADFQKGLACISEGDFDVCLLDFDLCGYTGIEFLNITNSLGIDCPIIILTSFDDYDTDLEVMNAGAVDLLNKNSLDEKTLERAIRYAISHHKTIQALKQSEQRLRQTAFFDNLTGLPNRALFLDRLNHAFKMGQRSNNSLALIIVNLDGFMPISDSYGHTVGDYALKEIAKRLLDSFRQADTIARLGGDEFAILLENVYSESKVLEITHQVRKMIQLPMQHNSGSHFSISASIGIAFSTASTMNPEELLGSADIAMYRAKNKQASGIEIFDRSMHKQISEQLHIKQDLKFALGKKEFELYYQPIVSLRTGKISGFEALLRWRKNGRLLGPSRFLEEAEASGEIVNISKWILIRACIWGQTINNRLMRKKGLAAKPLNIAVNISPTQFKDPNFIADVRQALSLSGLRPELLQLEITENIVLTDLKQSIKTLEALKQLGTRIFLDNFGTGNSSWQHILSLPIDALKLDRSFIQSLSNPKSQTIITALVLIAKQLELDIVVEGIETKAQLDYVQHKSQLMSGQGYLFSKPVSADACGQLINAELGQLEHSNALN